MSNVVFRTKNIIFTRACIYLDINLDLSKRGNALGFHLFFSIPFHFRRKTISKLIFKNGIIRVKQKFFRFY